MSVLPTLAGYKVGRVWYDEFISETERRMGNEYADNPMLVLVEVNRRIGKKGV